MVGTATVNTVEGVTWELSGRLYQTVYPFARNIYSSLNTLFGRTPKSNLPERIIHTGIVVYGYLYEYSNEGVKKTHSTDTGDPGSTCVVNQFLKRQDLGVTNVPIREFDGWVAQEKLEKFQVEKYDVGENHCVHFAIAAANFLGVKPPEEWEAMCKYTENNARFCRMADGSTQLKSSMSSSNL